MADRILIAEDEDHIARLVQFKLKRDGFDARIARNGREALDAIAAEPAAWRLLILDVMMPVCDGWEVLRQLRGPRGMGVALPVLMLTAKGYRQDVAQAAELGATRFLKKPFDPDELARVVREMLDGATPARTG